MGKSFAVYAPAGAARLPDSKVIVYDACGHWPHLEFPDRFNQHVTEFLGVPA